MTRLTTIVFAKPYKKFRNYAPAPLYKQILPAALKDTVSTKGEGRKVTPCLQEMSLMLNCLQKHDFSEVKCSKEVEQFLHCNASFKEAKHKKEEIISKGLLQSTVAGGKLPPKQLNSLLRQYPQPKFPPPEERKGRSKTRKG
ncbi:hypothetical protein LSAT2_030139 [Lamellibrachia satsuma]|nr:hypothetical protein LSAT2_030139 [Lamellibrachia satsuma]